MNANEVIGLDYSRLFTTLQEPPAVLPPVILPDFFLDHFVIAETFDTFIASLRSLAEQGGGNMIGTRHMIRRGGNSVNTASALLSLGILPHLIVKTDPQGLFLLRSLVSSELDLSHVKTNGRLSSTVSIEVRHKGRPVNLMVSDSGSAADFSFDDLNSNDLEAINNSSLVALLCLNHNKNAAQLAEDLFTYVRTNSKALTFMDIGDPSGNIDSITRLVKSTLNAELVDMLSLNENEAGWIARILTNNEQWHDAVKDLEVAAKAAELISKETGVRIDLHTQRFSATYMNDQTLRVSTFDVESYVQCGAGDSWNAGNIFATITGLPDIERLTLANAVAALYVSSTNATPPSNNDVFDFLKELI